MPDRDVFQNLLRGYAQAARALADRRLSIEGSTRPILLAVVRTLNRAGGVPAPFFAELCDALERARSQQRRTPLLAGAASAAYAHRQAIRTIRRRYSGVPLAAVVEDAAAQVLVDERGRASPKESSGRRALAQAILTQLFEHDFAGKVGEVLERQGFSLDEARARVEGCRQTVLGSPEFVALVRNLARSPQTSRRLGASVGVRKRSTIEIINQPIGDLLSASPEASA
jgi:hypothetical protein